MGVFDQVFKDIKVNAEAALDRLNDIERVLLYNEKEQNCDLANISECLEDLDTLLNMIADDAGHSLIEIAEAEAEEESNG